MIRRFQTNVNVIECLPMKTPLSLIPLPSSCVLKTGYVDFPPTSSIAWKGKDAEGVALLLAEYLRPATGFAWRVGADASRAMIVLTQTRCPKPDAAGFLPEDYTLSAQGGKVHIAASSAAGLARGIQTLRQLFPAEIYAPTRQAKPWRIPCVRIADAPQFRWRGLMLDVSRHFFSVDEVCRYIELLAQHRMNVCHLHLTDDQGWRVHIRRYPKLTSVGSRQDFTSRLKEGDRRVAQYDRKPGGGFFTRKDIKAIVDFAARRHVTVVPEIEVPGHSQAAIAAYPELGNRDASPQEPAQYWGNVLNIDNATVRFMKNVLDEVMEMFPSKFIHIGGDEVDKRQWNASRRARALMRRRGLKGADEAQSWMIGEIDRHVAKRGRRAIGWDEILEGGLAKGATVMSWRGEQGGIAAARQGHDVVMAPTSHTYFDYYQSKPVKKEPLAIGGMTTLRKVYGFSVIPAEIPASRRHHVLGGQGQLWTEYIASCSYLDYMAYPRACALAEALWSPDKKRSFPEFMKRLRTHRQRFKAQDVNAWGH